MMGEYPGYDQFPPPKVNLSGQFYVYCDVLLMRLHIQGVHVICSRLTIFA